MARPLEPADRALLRHDDGMRFQAHGAAIIATMLHAISVRAVRLRDRPLELGCDRLRGVGYQAVCSCGYRSPTKGEHRLARAEGRLHLEGNPPRGESAEGLAGEPKL